jgi:hypothetical protein
MDFILGIIIFVFLLNIILFTFRKKIIKYIEKSNTRSLQH